MLRVLFKMENTDAGNHYWMSGHSDVGSGSDANDRLKDQEDGGRRAVTMGGAAEIYRLHRITSETGWAGPDTTRDFLLIF